MGMTRNQAGLVTHAVYRAMSGAASCVLQSATVDMAGCDGCSFIEQQVQLEMYAYTWMLERQLDDVDCRPDWWCV